MMNLRLMLMLEEKKKMIPYKAPTRALYFYVGVTILRTLLSWRTKVNRIKVVDFNGEHALLILEAGTWNLVAKGSFEDMAVEEQDYIQKYPFLRKDEVLNVQHMPMAELDKAPGVFHKVRKPFSQNGLFAKF